MTFSLMETLDYDFLVLPSPMEVFRAQIYGWAMLVLMLLAAITGFGRSFEGHDVEEIKTRINV